MNQFAIVSLDMFQTLVNVNSRIEQIWKPILSDTYSLDTANDCAQLLLDYFFEHSIRLKEAKSFCLTGEVYKLSFESVFQKMNISYELEEAVHILFQERVHADFYEDTVGFLNRVIKKYITCIVSDADLTMIPRFYTDYGIQAFISEHYQSYKNDGKNTMFKELLKFLMQIQKKLFISEILFPMLQERSEKA